MSTKTQKQPCKNCGETHAQANSATSFRQKANRDLVKILHTLVEQNPDLRLSQILLNNGFVSSTQIFEQSGYDRAGFENYWADEYHMEPDRLLERVKKTLRR